MNEIRLILLLILLACLLIACGSKEESLDAEPLKPGDALGDMTLVVSSSPTPHLYTFCEEDELLSGDCLIPGDIGHLWITNGWEEETAEALEAVWKDENWQLVVDGRTVDLPAFGYVWYDDEYPTSHVWNVALRSPTEGEHRVVWTHDMAGEQGEERWLFTVTDELSFNE